MSFGIKPHFFSWLILFAFIVSGCTVEMNQPAEMTSPTMPVPNAPAVSATSVFPMTQLPVKWANLNLTGKLIYTSSTNDQPPATKIQVLDLKSGDLATIYDSSDGWMYYATVSPDEKTLAVSYSPAGQANASSNRSLFLIPLDKIAQPQPLFVPPTADDHYTQVEWSPDGNNIYFVHYNHNNSGGQFYEVYEIYRMAYPNGTPEKIIDRAYWPRLSSEGARLVYVTLDPVSGLNELFTANADGSNSQKITFSGSWIPDIIDAPIFLPDGKSILFSAPGPGTSYQPSWFEKLAGIQVAEAHSIPSDWWSVPIDGGAPTQLTKIQTVNLFAAISPDQKHVASLSGDGIFVMDLDGSNLTQLVSNPGVHGTVSWIP
jgi:Tol biopolymer transport system component